MVLNIYLGLIYYKTVCSVLEKCQSSLGHGDAVFFFESSLLSLYLYLASLGGKVALELFDFFCLFCLVFHFSIHCFKYMYILGLICYYNWKGFYFALKTVVRFI